MPLNTGQSHSNDLAHQIHRLTNRISSSLSYSTTVLLKGYEGRISKGKRDVHS